MSKQRQSKSQWIREAVIEYENPLTLYVTRILGDPHRAGDVVQDTFLKLCKAEKEKIDDHLAEWLYTVARNRALDVKRKEKRRFQLSDERLSYQQQDEEASPYDQASTHDESNKMLRLLEGLSENQREVIQLKFQHHMSYKQISEITGLTVSNVGFLIHTGLKNLKEQMENGGKGKGS